MLELASISFGDLFELGGTIATVIALIFAIKSFRKNNQLQEAMFIKNLFEGFQRDRQAVLDNPTTLKILATEWEKKPEELIRDSLGSFGINRAYLLFYLHQERLTPESRWTQDKRDIEVLFSDSLVANSWWEIQEFYPEDFQTFINTQIFRP
ncbi:MAG: hypothetical protein AAF135_26980 [Bacteroidota bacterium]